MTHDPNRVLPLSNNKLFDRLVAEVTALGEELRQAHDADTMTMRVRVLDNDALQKLPRHKQWLTHFEPFWLPPHASVQCWRAAEMRSSSVGLVVIFIHPDGSILSLTPAISRVAHPLCRHELLSVPRVVRCELVEQLKQRREQLQQRRTYRTICQPAGE